MNNWTARHKRPYVYNSKLVMDGTVERVKRLKSEGKSFAEIGELIGKSRQQVSQIYHKAIANMYKK